MKVFLEIVGGVLVILTWCFGSIVCAIAGGKLIYHIQLAAASAAWQTVREFPFPYMEISSFVVGILIFMFTFAKWLLEDKKETTIDSTNPTPIGTVPYEDDAG